MSESNGKSTDTNGADATGRSIANDVEQHAAHKQQQNDCTDKSAALSVHSNGVNPVLDLQHNPAGQSVAEIAHRTATLGSRWNWLNWTWSFLWTAGVPGLGAVIWWGLIPVGSPQGGYADKAVFVFLIHPVSAAFLSYILCTMFLIAFDQEKPWRPVGTFLPTVSAVFFTQVLFPGLQVLLHNPIEVMAIPALFLTFLVTIIGVHQTPAAWMGFCCVKDAERLAVARRVFTKISITFVIYTWVLAGYTFTYAKLIGVAEGMITVLLSVLCFIFKKTMLAFTDQIGIDSAMLVAGFWLENLTDMFITLAFPAAENFGPTFGIIFASRVIENAAYLGFQLDIWFNFRIWIKGKFKKDQAAGIEEDLEEYADDRGHSAFHPGYRRRQLRFLALKIFSQVSSYCYFMMICPVLRYGPNKLRFPYRKVEEEEHHHEVVLKAIYGDSRLDPSRGFLSNERFNAAMAFAVFQIFAVLCGAVFIWWWMHRYCRDIIIQVREHYSTIGVDRVHYALVLGTMISNALIATSFIQVYYRVFFL